MVASLWSALPLAERAKYERKAGQNLQIMQNVQNLQYVQNMQNVHPEVKNNGRDVEEGWRGGQRVEERGKFEERRDKRESLPNWQANSIAEQEMPPEGKSATAPAPPPTNSPPSGSLTITTPPSPPSESSTTTSPPPTSSPAPAALPVSSPAEENSLDFGDSQPYRIFYSELRQVLFLSSSFLRRETSKL